jgi:hypothetical protein
MSIVIIACVSIACLIALLVGVISLRSQSKRNEWAKTILAPLAGLLVNSGWALFGTSQDQKLGGYPYRHSDGFWNFVALMQLILPISAIILVVVVARSRENKTLKEL